MLLLYKLASRCVGTIWPSAKVQSITIAVVYLFRNNLLILRGELGLVPEADDADTVW
jgi:hypothetical protein